MEDDQDSKSSLPDPIQDLEAAIQNLEEFANQNESEPIPNVQNLEVEGDALISTPVSGIHKTIDLIKSVFPKSREKHLEKRLQVQKKLLESIEFLKTHYRTINKFKRGSEAEQELAKWAHTTINRYNTLISKSKQSPQSLKERVAQFVYEQSGLSLDDELKNIKIDVPHEFSVQFESSKQAQPSQVVHDHTSEKISTFLQHTDMTPHRLTKQEKEIFLMKTISLGKSALPPTIRQTFSTLLREAPIRSVTAQGEEAESASIISLEQTITAFPGEKITVQGAFKRDARSPVPSVPIPESFHVSTKATQTGFPHPSQNTGWALSNALIPECPLRMDQMPLFEQVYEAKKKIASELLPEGRLNEKAKKLLKLKKEAFEKELPKFLGMHRELSLAIINAASVSDVLLANAEEMLEIFYRQLKQNASAFEFLCQTYHVLNTSYIERLWNNLHAEWLEQHNPDILSRDPKVSYQACVHVLDRELEKASAEILTYQAKAPSAVEKAILDYILIFGELIGGAAKAIILQQLSEKIGFPPPLLSNFEQKLQSCTYKQMLAFQGELELDIDSQPELVIATLQERLQQQLESEIALFQAETCDAVPGIPTEITHELEFYYNARYYARL